MGGYRLKEREQRARRWHERRRELGLTSGKWDSPLSREAVAPLLGLSLRTVQRYEFGEAPAWYDFALIGLAVKLKGGKQKA